MALLRQKHLVRFFVNREVSGRDDALACTWVFLAHLAGQHGHNLVDGHVEFGVIFGLSADDERCAGFVDQNRIDFVDDGVMHATLHTVFGFVDHVVSQVIKTKFVVGAVGDVCTVSGLFVGARHLWQVDADGQPEEVVQATHPLCIAVGQVVIHRDHMHAFSSQCIEVDGQGGSQGFAFAGSHLCDLALVQCDAAHQLHIEVAHLHHALRAFAHYRKRFWQYAVNVLALLQSGFEGIGLRSQCVVIQRFQSTFQCVDLRDGFAIGFEHPIIAAAKNRSQ